jgi:hypothetical protein
MAKAARVLSVEALTAFRNSMIKFGEEAKGALSGVDMELRRMRDWLERDQLGYWMMQVKRRQEEVMNARTELARRKIAAQGSDTISDTEQKEKLREAQRRLRVAEEKVAVVKKLIPELHRTIAEYKSCSSPLGDHLGGGLEKSIHRIGMMVKSLEAYLALRAPAGGGPSAAGGGGGGASGSGSSASAGGSARAGGVSESSATAGDGQAAPAPAAAPADAEAPAREPAEAANPS